MNRNLDSKEYYTRGIESYRSRHFDKAVLLCKRVLTIDSDYSNAHFQWSSNLIAKKDYDKSIRKLKGVISRNPTDSMVYYNLGLTLELQNKLMEAENEYKKSIGINPDYKKACYSLAIVLTKQGKYAEALERHEKNLKGGVELISTYNSYGYLKLILGKYEEAIESFEEAIFRDPDQSLSLFNKSMALYCLKKPKLAVEALEKSFDEFRGSDDLQQILRNDLSIYEGELGRFEKAFEGVNLGEISREQLSMMIKALHFIVTFLKQELAKILKKEE